MKKKIYRAPKVVEGQIKAQRGKIDGDVDMCIFYGDNVPRCDRALVMNILYSDRYDTFERKSSPSFAEELKARGYDLNTFKFSIERKQDA
jgi:hypothetical protein